MAALWPEAVSSQTWKQALSSVLPLSQVLILRVLGSKSLFSDESVLFYFFSAFLTGLEAVGVRVP